MDLIQLEHFLAVADERNLTRAAERVFLTQPALSQSIKKLEQSVGTPLFARDLNGISLTSAAKLLIVYARAILKIRDHPIRSPPSLHHIKAGTPAVSVQ